MLVSVFWTIGIVIDAAATVTVRLLRASDVWLISAVSPRRVYRTTVFVVTSASLCSAAVVLESVHVVP